MSANFGLPFATSPYEGSGGGTPSFSAGGGTSALASVDAVQEFTVQTSTYAPEYGRQPGAQLAIVTRSGANDFHGSAFDYLRNDKLDANSWFGNFNGLKRPALRQNDFGFTAGGPTRIPGLYDGRNRTFFFVSYEGLRLVQPVISPTVRVPSLAARERATGLLKSILEATLPSPPRWPTHPTKRRTSPAFPIHPISTPPAFVSTTPSVPASHYSAAITTRRQNRANVPAMRPLVSSPCSRPRPRR
ncbi:MAG: hypothetical protein LC114_02760 [Bryobacterales bacterium]|nr:hypothetical protein [Bryobacterales bacterium]